jgi:predicted amidohydrolase YtcJ
MLQPYEGSAAAAAWNASGETTFTPDDLNRTVRLADAAGWQILTHATGDRAVRLALNAYAHAVRSNRPPARGRRHRIEGAAFVDRADIPRFGVLGVVASMQPSRANPTAARIDALLRDVGEERAGRSFPFRSLAEETRLVFGSGWPAYTLNPLAGLHIATTQTTVDDAPEGGWHPAERLQLKPALDAYTSGAAWASFDEQRKGSLAPGMLADLVVLSEDIFAEPAAKLSAASVAVTIFDGKIVYRRADRPETTLTRSLQQ